MKITRLLAATALAVLSLAACDDAGDASSATGTPAAAGSTPTQVDAAEQAIVEAALLTLKDFPAGWEAAPLEADSSDFESEKELASCVGVEWDELFGGTTAEAESLEFISSYAEAVSMSALLEVDEDRAASVFEIHASDEYRKCAMDAIATDIESTDMGGAEVGELRMNELSVGSIGDESIGYRVTTPITNDGETIDVVAEVVIVRVGRGALVFTSISYELALPTSELVELIEISAKRLADALG